MPLLRLFIVTFVAVAPGCSPEEVSVHRSEITGPTRIVLDLPSDLIVIKQTEDAIIAESFNVNLLIARCPEIRFRSMRSNLSQMATIRGTRPDRIALPEQSFHSGNAAGYKYVLGSKEFGATIEAKYLLKVPGGFVAVIMSNRVGEQGIMTFDESRFEPTISTARIVGIK